jgi:hypothetical protein
LFFESREILGNFLARYTAAMPQVEVVVKCSKCSAFVPSPIRFAKPEFFDSAKFTGNKLRCRKCGTMTDCNKDNMRMRWVNDDGTAGGFVGEST